MTYIRASVDPEYVNFVEAVLYQTGLASPAKPLDHWQLGGVNTTGCSSLAVVDKEAIVHYKADHFFWKKADQ
jgi:hypothetical protein